MIDHVFGQETDSQQWCLRKGEKDVWRTGGSFLISAFNWCQSTGLSTDVRVMVDSKFAEPGV
jgi:hypothetical protein